MTKPIRALDIRPGNRQSKIAIINLKSLSGVLFLRSATTTRRIVIAP